MNARLMDTDLDTARIRALQGIYFREHAALMNWGRWSNDRRGIFPKAAGSILGAQYRRSEGEEYGDETKPDQERLARVAAMPRRSEPRERLPYEEKTAVILDERIHHPGGLNVEIRRCLRIAYVTREVPEDQFAKRAGCLVDTFCERLEEALRFVRRFA